MRHPKSEKVVLREGEDIYVQVAGLANPDQRVSVSGIDWLELAQQKHRLVSYLWDKDEGDRDFIMWGIVNLIDALQDQAVEDGLPVVFVTAEEPDGKDRRMD
jgi:hypothetical protein